MSGVIEPPRGNAAPVHRHALKLQREVGGFSCPACGASTAVGDSRPIDGSIRRRRYCKCGNRFSTVEIPADAMIRRNHLKTLLLQAEQMVSAATYMAMAIREALVSLPVE